jgi:U3 small nucleolar RNA-associated protein 23
MGRRKDKWIKKTLNFYRFIFKFDSPYKVIIDGNFAAMALSKKFEMKTSLEKLLDEKIILIIPSCIFKEVQSIESKIPGLLKLLSQYKIEQCKHSPMSATNCIRDYIGKKNNSKYFVATQDNFLRVQLRKVPGVPLIFFEQNMLLMDKPSRISIEASERRENLKEDPKKKEKKELNEKKNEISDFLVEEFKNSKYYKRKQEEFKLNKLMGKIRKKAKGPNPLSVKKKKSYYIQKEKDFEYKKKMGLINENNKQNLISLNENENENENDINDNKEGNKNKYNNKDINKEDNKIDNNNDGNDDLFIKKKRRRHKKRKNEE